MIAQQSRVTEEEKQYTNKFGHRGKRRIERGGVVAGGEEPSAKGTFGI